MFKYKLCLIKLQGDDVMTVTKKLKKIGNSNFILIPKDAMESLGLQGDSTVQMKVDELRIVIEKSKRGGE